MGLHNFESSSVQAIKEPKADFPIEQTEMNSPLRAWSPKRSDGNTGGANRHSPEVWKILRSKISELKEERQNMLALLQQKEEEIARLRGELDIICEGQNNHEKEIRTLQQAAFRQMKEAGWVPQEETAFQEVLRDCNENIWVWARSHAIKSFDDGNEAYKDLLECLSHTVQLKDGEFPEYFSKGKFATQAPILLVASTVSEEIYHRTICEPFLVFYTPFEDSKQPPESERSCKVVNCLSDVYSQLNKR
jgi:hypothetical protein